MPSNTSLKNEFADTSRILTLLASLLRLLVMTGLIALLIWGWHLYKDPQFMPVRQVKIIAPYQKMSRQNLINIITPYTANTGLLSFDMEKLKNVLLQQPWIYKVIIKRVWPDEIAITIQEQQAVALWNKQNLLNAAGEVFSPPVNTFPTHLPIINCSDGQQTWVLQKLQQYNQALAPYNLSIATLNLNSRGSWQMLLNNGMAITLGRINPEQRFARFIATYPLVLANQVQNITSIDLRYPDGFAVAWKTAIPVPVNTQ